MQIDKTIRESNIHVSHYQVLGPQLKKPISYGALNERGYQQPPFHRLTRSLAHTQVGIQHNQFSKKKRQDRGGRPV